MNRNRGLALSFDDISLVPGYSEVLPTEVDLKTTLTSKKNGLSLSLDIPIMSSAMDTITEWEMARALGLSGGLGVIHKNMSIEEQANHVSLSKKDTSFGFLVGAAISAGSDCRERSSWLVESGVDVLVVDSAHGHSKNVLDTVRMVKKLWPKMFVVAGNVCTEKAVFDLVQAGADCIKINVGSGSICTTRVVSGVGVPSFSSILECSAAADNLGVSSIADGGVRYSGDVAKALAAGADCVMIGSMLAGTKETPGEEFEDNGVLYKAYRGMGSVGAMQKGSADRYGQSRVASEKLVPEGVESRVRVKSCVEEVLHQICGGVRSSFGYLGAKDIKSFQARASWVQVTASGVREAHPHSLESITPAPNYKR